MKFYRKVFTLSILVSIVFSGTIIINSCSHQPYVLPMNLRTGDPTICFERDILPIFQSNCAKSGCHDAGSGKSGYKLDTYSDIISKGIVPGNPAASKIWESVSMHTFNVTFMPIDAPSLTGTELELIQRWIATGAIDSGACTITPCDTTNITYSGTIAPIMQSNCTGCHFSSSSTGGSLANYASVQNAAVNGRLIGDISHLTGYNAMPLGGKLQDCQIIQIKKWVAAGAPNN